MKLTNRRFPLRFSLRTLLLLVLITAIWMGWQTRWIRQRHELLQKHEALAATLENHKRGLLFSLEQQQVCESNIALPRSHVSAPGLLWLLGEPPVEQLHLHFTVTSAEEILAFDDPEIDRARSLFPEAMIVRSVHTFSKTPFPD